jgi:predicted RNase H-related nuclease YkuK (DUF458 family)
MTENNIWINEVFTNTVKAAIKEASPTSSFYIGCDSSVSRTPFGKEALYVVVFIVHMNSCNGAKILHRKIKMPEYGNLRQRLNNEVELAKSLALEIIDDLDGRKLEIHLDINPNPKHKSNIIAKEALSYVRSMGLDAKIKPHSFAASHAADHLT